ISRVVRSNMASHCASSSQFSADSTTFLTITRFRGRGCEELTRPSRILSIVATLQSQGQVVRSGQPQPRGVPGETRDGGEFGEQQLDRPPPLPGHPSPGGSWQAWARRGQRGSAPPRPVADVGVRTPTGRGIKPALGRVKSCCHGGCRICRGEVEVDTLDPDAEVQQTGSEGNRNFGKARPSAPPPLRPSAPPFTLLLRPSSFTHSRAALGGPPRPFGATQARPPLLESRGDAPIAGDPL
uniref:Uncharacterized protein n=1 Tax=Sus scrofa TaxID=9823 RepID=A0A8D0SRR6_PIG